ncbi:MULTISPECIES: trimeric intracellular cation channel family protein [Persicobacter]|uniref:Membrane protein n=1 Tax=Persicobacter diffluens TaxID=981 RepID=A0AAN4VUK0_9BACT|nr:trimeric intracellular cation channel family protein [Persicobacter sp. CCB-QB2]GJM60246.1 membrane protein [Persicobacter diffluens]
MHQEFIYFLDLAGTLAFAISGIQTAADKKMDVFGAMMIGFITALGGGTVRDMLLGNQPVFWFHDLNYLAVVGIAVGIVYAFAGPVRRLKQTLFLFDTIGIGVFTVIGVTKGLDAGISAPYAVIMGMVSSVVGGATRDVLCNEIPLILRKEVYATACLFGGAVYVILHGYGLDEVLVSFVTMGVVIAIRLLSIKHHISLPRMRS